MVLIRTGVLVSIVVGLAGGCSPSLFDDGSHGARSANPDGATPGDAGPADASVMVPSTCRAPCLADAAADFNGTTGGTGNHWRYLDDRRDRKWAAMTASALVMTGADPGNRITSCAAKRDAPACQALPGALLVSAAGAQSAADPAIEFTAARPQVIQLAIRAYVPAGADQAIRIYRNSREDVLFTGVAVAGALLEQLITLDALAGDRFLVALAPAASGAADVALQVFVSGAAASFPDSCQLAVTFSASAGNTIENLCGGSDFTFGVFDGNDLPPALAAGPFAELGSSGDIATGRYYRSSGTLDRSRDTTVQLWVKLRGFVDSENAWPFSDLDLEQAGGLGIAIVNDTEPVLDVTTCLTATPTDNTFADAKASYPGDGAWHFLRVVHVGGNVHVCIDGKRRTSIAVAPGRLQSTYAPHLGSNVRWSPVGAFFDGQLDDVRVLTGALPCN